MKNNDETHSVNDVTYTAYTLGLRIGLILKPLGKPIHTITLTIKTLTIKTLALFCSPIFTLFGVMDAGFYSEKEINRVLQEWRANKKRR